MIKYASPLLIGDLVAGIAINGDEVLYVSLGTHGADEGDSGEILSIDEIEARALHEWLGSVLDGDSKHATDRPLTRAQSRCVALLRCGPLHRRRDDWATAGGQSVALNTAATLRKRGLARLSADRRWLHFKGSPPDAGADQ